MTSETLKQLNDALDRHRQRIAELKAAGSRDDRVAIFERIASEVNIHEARSCWIAAFPGANKKGGEYAQTDI